MNCMNLQSAIVADHIFFINASGSCSHIIGLPIVLQHWILMGFKAVPDNLTCFSLPQQWSVPRGSKIESAAAPQICIIKPHPDRKQKPVENVLTVCRQLKNLITFNHFLKLKYIIF